VLRRYQAATSIAPSLAIQASLVVSGVLSARLLGPDFRGHLALATLLPGVVAVVALLGLPNAVVYFTARDRQGARGVVASSLVVAVPMILIAELAHLALFWLLFAGDTGGIRAAVSPTLLIVPALVIHFLAVAHLQGTSRYHAMNVLRVAPFFLYAAGVAVCFALRARSLELVVWSYALAYAIIAIASFAILRRTLSTLDTTVARTSPRALLGFGARGLAVGLSPIESFRADQLLVGAAMPAAALGYYSVATAFSVFPRLVTQSLGLIAGAEVAGDRDLARSQASARGFLLTATLLVGFTVAAIEILLPLLIPWLFGDAFRPALTCARLLVAGAGLLGLRRFVTDLIRGLGRPGAESIAELTTWPVLLVGGLIALGSGTFGGGIEAVAGVVLVASGLSLIVALASFAGALRPRH
jgi:O-antigen/teichoic acid export membrane protein